MDDPLLRDVFLGFIKLHVLHHAAEAPVYDLAVIEEPGRHVYEVSLDTLYPVLHGLDEAGHLAGSSQVVGSKVRKYYTITATGRTVLNALRPAIRELVAEVLAGDAAVHDRPEAEHAGG